MEKQHKHPALTEAEALVEVLREQPELAAIERACALEGMPFEDAEEVGHVDTPVLSGPEITVETRVNAILAKADPSLTYAEALQR